MKTFVLAIVVVFCFGFAVSVFAQDCGTCRQNFYETTRIIGLMEPQVDKVNAGYRGTLGRNADQRTVNELRNCIERVCSGEDRTKALRNVNWIQRALSIYSGQPIVVLEDPIRN